MGNSPLSGAGAWGPYLAPGMWVKASGTWQGHTFVAANLRVLSPPGFSCYLGPADLVGLGPGWVEAWYVPGSGSRAQLFFEREAEPGRRVHLLVNSAAPVLPPGLRLGGALPARAGWDLLISGLNGRGQLAGSWRLAAQLP